jgi:hypothetical protein
MLLVVDEPAGAGEQATVLVAWLELSFICARRCPV